MDDWIEGWRAAMDSARAAETWQERDSWTRYATETRLAAAAMGRSEKERARQPERGTGDRRPMALPRPTTRTGRLAQRMYANRRDVRERVARALEARIMGSPPRAEGIVCPSCGRPSVWWWIDPDAQWWAECYHEQSCGWRGSLLDLDPDTLPRKPAPTRTARPMRARRAPLPDDPRLRELDRLLRADRRAREHLARSLGAEVTGSPPRADCATCPACGRPSVWWWIEPGLMAGAACTHRHTCGWRGSLADLAWSMT